MGYRGKDIDTYDYGTIHVGTLRTFGVNCRNGFQYEGPLSTIIDLSDKADMVNAYNPCPQGYYNAINYDRPLDYDWTTDINNINQYIYWIWGGVASGGVGLIKMPNSFLGWVCSHGYYINNAGTAGRYYLSYFRTINGTNYANSNPDLKWTQVAFHYNNEQEPFSNLISPTPDDRFSPWISVQLNRGLQDNNNDELLPWHYWRRLGDGSITDFYHYVPEGANNFIGTVDLSTIFDSSSAFGTNIGLNTKGYYPEIVFRTYTGTQILSTQDILDDDYYGFNGYVHQSGHWYGVERDDDNEGGDGDGDDSQGGSTPFHVTDIPYDVTDTGFVRLYKSAPVDLRALANFMFASLTTDQSATLKKLLSNPLDYIICLNACHFDVTAGDYEEIKIGGINTTVQSRPVSQFVHLSGGSYTLNHYWGSFMDYAPFTTVQIHVPYCGTHTLDTDLVMNSTLFLDYEIDLLSGTLVAQLSISKPNDLKNQPDSIGSPSAPVVIETYTGNVFTQIPIANTDYRQMIASVLGIASSAVTSVASNNPLPLASGVANAVTNSKTNVSKNGSISNNYGYMSHQNAFLIISRPCLTMSGNDVDSELTKYHDWLGYPCNMVKKVGDFSGVLTIQKGTFWSGDNSNSFDSITDAEKEELSQIMDGGICI